MDEEWQNIIKNHKKVKSSKLLFIRRPAYIEINNNISLTENFNSNLLQNNDRKFIRNFEPEYRLDLHGYNKNDAFNELIKFINLNFQNGNRKLIVITGKGIKNGSMGVLRSSIADWLTDQAIRYMIASYSSASA